MGFIVSPQGSSLLSGALKGWNMAVPSVREVSLQTWQPKPFQAQELKLPAEFVQTWQHIFCTHTAVTSYSDSCLCRYLLQAQIQVFFFSHYSEVIDFLLCFQILFLAFGTSLYQRHYHCWCIVISTRFYCWGFLWSLMCSPHSWH